MANTKGNTKASNTQKNRPAHSGFEAEPPRPVQPYPIGTTFRRNANGTVTPVFPKKTSKKK